MHGLVIWGLSILSAIVYGIVHDQVTIRICPAYFTEFHPAIFPTESLTLLALGWGVVATWWMGAFLGLPLALAARLGRWPQLTAGVLLKPIGVVLLMMAMSALGAGFIGYRQALADGAEPMSARFFADLAAHNTAYAVAGIAGGGLIGWVIARRKALARTAQNHTAGG